MRRPLSHLPALLLCAAIAGCADASAPPEETGAPERHGGPHVEVFCHASCGRDSLRVVAVAEGAWTRAAAVFGGLPRYRPVTIHLVDQAGYAAADRRLNGGRRLANGAFSEARSRSAWIAVSPAPLAAHADRLGLPPHTLRGIAHEVFHLVSYQAVRYGTHLPDWLAEGGAAWVEGQTVQSMGILAPAREDPWASTLLWLAGDRIPSAPRLWLADMLTEGPEVVGADSGDYGLRLALFSFLQAEQPALLERIIRAARSAPRASFVGGTIAGAVHGALDERELSRLQRSFQRQVRSWRAHAGWLEGRRHLGTAGSIWPQGGFGEASAVALRWDQPFSGPYRVRGVVEPLSGEGSSFTVMVDWTLRRAVHATLRGDGLVTVREHLGADLEKEPARILARGGSPTIPLDGPTPFEVRVLEHEIILLLDGREAARAARRSAPPDARWGLAVSAEGAVLWHDVVAEALPARLTVELRGY